MDDSSIQELIAAAEDTVERMACWVGDAEMFGFLRLSNAVDRSQGVELDPDCIYDPATDSPPYPPGMMVVR